MKTGQRQVFQRIVAALRDGQDVVNREGDELPVFVRVAVLAKKSGALPHLFPDERRDFTRQG
jgi:hypothetical protein